MEPADFRSLAALLRVPPPDDVPAPAAGAVPVPSLCRCAGRTEEFLAELARLRARASESFEEACQVLLRELAIRVVARELQLAPAETAAIARELLAEYAEEEPLRVRVAAGDLDRVRTLGLPTIVDPALRPGDAIVEVRDGLLDARLGIRLARALAATSGTMEEPR